MLFLIFPNSKDDARKTYCVRWGSFGTIDGFLNVTEDVGITSNVIFVRIHWYVIGFINELSCCEINYRVYDKLFWQICNLAFEKIYK